MKIPHKQELQEIAFIAHHSDIEFKDFMNLYKTFTGKLYSFLAIDAILAPDNSSRFGKYLSERT